MTSKPGIGTVIVLFGISRAGKDTVKELIVQSLRERCDKVRFMPECIAFADPIKRAALELFGVPLSISYAPQDVRESTVFYGKTVRQIHQWLGTEIGRDQIDPNLWVERTGDHIHRILDAEVSEAPVIVSDGRFRNERDHLAPYLAKIGSLRPVRNVLVYRPGLEPNLAHESERQPWQMTTNATSWIAAGGSRAGCGFHEIIVNDGSLETLRAKVDDLCRRLIR